MVERSTQTPRSRRRLAAVIPSATGFVEFDDVAYEQDEQCLEFANNVVVRLRVRRGKARVQLDHHRRKSRAA